MSRIFPILLACVSLASGAHATILTITPDKSTYLVGETITLSVFGDAEGSASNGIFGALLFDAAIADYGSSSQSTLTSFGGLLVWMTGPLSGGPGFAEAFFQTPGGAVHVPDDPLSATVTLLATAPGTLDYQWAIDPDPNFLNFFGLTNAPGGSVTIVPEPSTALLVSLALVGLTLGRSARKRTC